ncbi:hypothetical protein RO3G_12614 [Rhizopus delemar RA 99-880]|uniref:Uncharacterized protein n=1 Tax=Rhizopus delemar (strain RA 99-880 / ATCC MYA-4621 / FGSC 9543 / NRRL 43880) TaxID=246409 RepID=I1CHH3_RHIO9|nr:hypothetical protein RO3G_12614 [Rhizopus delemar RA 99-880]|eukprot:EIE87903.1 hypothetical protein RO3G_12614 [Rhizopus delemar RA 99-880]
MVPALPFYSSNTDAPAGSSEEDGQKYSYLQPADVREIIEKKRLQMCLSSSIFTFLYPIDGFWSKIKYNIKRHPFDSSCNLRSQITRFSLFSEVLNSH